jgi:hypothetical protein
MRRGADRETWLRALRGAVARDDTGCGIHSIAITETSPSRSPKTVDGDHRKRSIAIGGPTSRPRRSRDLPGLIRGYAQA